MGGFGIKSKPMLKCKTFVQNIGDEEHANIFKLKLKNFKIQKKLLQIQFFKNKIII
jgi:hypothetical protein